MDGKIQAFPRILKILQDFSWALKTHEEFPWASKTFQDFAGGLTVVTVTQFILLMKIRYVIIKICSKLVCHSFHL